MNDNNTHPYQVVTWQPRTEGLLGAAHWLEMCRCITEWRAEEIAHCLSLRHKLVAVAKLDEAQSRFINYLWFPDEATVKAVASDV